MLFRSDNDELVRQIKHFAISKEDRIQKGNSGRNYVLQNLTVKKQAAELAHLLFQRLNVKEITMPQ